MGRAHLAQGQNTLALSALNQALHLAPSQPQALALRGTILRQIGDLSGALADYQHAQELALSSPALNFEKGLTLLQLGRLQAAEPELRVAAEQLPHHSTLHLLHASLAHAIGSHQAAAVSLSQILKRPTERDDTPAAPLTEQSEIATYLHILLSAKGHRLPPINAAQAPTSAHLFRQYTEGSATRKRRA